MISWSLGPRETFRLPRRVFQSCLLFPIPDLQPSFGYRDGNPYRRNDLFSNSIRVQDSLHSASMSTFKPAETPLTFAHPPYSNIDCQMDKERDEMNIVTFRQILGSLIYLSIRSIPDIFTAVSLLGKYQSDPSIQHWEVFKHLVWYLQGTIDYCVMSRTYARTYAL